jgi:PKD repeat protein
MIVKYKLPSVDEKFDLFFKKFIMYLSYIFIYITWIFMLYNYIIGWLIMMCVWLHHGVIAQWVTTNVPAEYYPDYLIAGNVESLLQTIITLEANVQSGKEPALSLFSTFNTVFNALFAYFPQTPNYQITYEQCRILSSDLSAKYSNNIFVIFKEKCLSPINGIIRQMQQWGTIKIAVQVLPKDWPAPHNVTLDARGSLDPSWDTIPNDNYFWYYKDDKGKEVAIWRWVIINHTFPEPGTYIVHLTVRSVNNTTKWVFDGSAKVSVNVWPRVAKFGVYLNGRKVESTETFRIGAQEAVDGILVDGTATVPIWWRTIVNHTWSITWPEKFLINKKWNGSPTQFIAKMPRNGDYQLVLEITDNQKNIIKETYAISVSDPVAIIKITPRDNGTTSAQYSFDASASYGLANKINRYQRTISDPEGEIINNEESAMIKRFFTKPWWYNVKLAVFDELGRDSFDTRQFYVNSTAPLAWFTYRPYVNLKEPSQFVLDASSTFDEDVRQQNDTLRYERSFDSQEHIIVDQTIEEWKQAIITVNQPGTYKIRLTVTDSYGLWSSTDKSITVKSSLRPTLTVANPNVQLWSEMEMSVDANKSIALVERDFGDTTQYRSTDLTARHEYKKSGVYNLKLKVSTIDGESNELTRMVFVWQKDAPSVAYEIVNQQKFIMEANAFCQDSDGIMQPAFVVDRYQPVAIDASKSIDSQWWTSKLRLSMKPDGELEVQNRNNLNHNFTELGCRAVTIIAEDLDLKTTDTKQARFFVQNALPTIDRLQISFPQQAGDPRDINQWLSLDGSTSSAQKMSITDILNNDLITNVTVKLQAHNIKDLDWSISRLVWYYYRLENPERLIEAKVTPATVNFINFSIPKPRQAGEFGFWVKMVDNDGGEITSEEVLWWVGPTIFFPADISNPDVPIVTVKTDKSVAKVGEEVEITANASLISTRSDFEELRFFKFDPDGDGIYDITTKSPTIKWVYEQSGYFAPKIAVYYRERAGIGRADEIQVQEWLLAVYEVASYDRHVLVRDFSIWDIESRDICLDVKMCARDQTLIHRDRDVVHHIYPDYGDYMIRARLTDKYANSEWFSHELKLVEQPELGILSIPQSSKSENGDYRILLGNNNKNTLHLYVVQQGTWSCFIDVDITVDSDRDGDPTTDPDRACNQLITKEFFPTTKEQYASLQYDQDWITKKAQIILEFLDTTDVVPESYAEIIALIDMLIRDSNDRADINENMQAGYLRDLLVNLKASINQKEAVDSIILQVNDLLLEYNGLRTTEQKDQWIQIYQILSNPDINASLGLWVYELSKQNIIAWFDDLAKEIVIEHFREFEANAGNQTMMKAALDKVWQAAVDELQAGNLDSVDMNYIKKSLCDIALFYELPARTCDEDGWTGAANVETIAPVVVEWTTEWTSASGGGSSILWWIIKIILWIAGILLLVFIVFFVIGVVKARKRAALEAAEGEGDGG